MRAKHANMFAVLKVKQSNIMRNLVNPRGAHENV